MTADLAFPDSFRLSYLAHRREQRGPERSGDRSRKSIALGDQRHPQSDLTVTMNPVALRQSRRLPHEPSRCEEVCFATRQAPGAYSGAAHA